MTEPNPKATPEEEALAETANIEEEHKKHYAEANKQAAESTEEKKENY